MKNSRAQTSQSFHGAVIFSSSSIMTLPRQSLGAGLSFASKQTRRGGFLLQFLPADGTIAVETFEKELQV